MESKSVTCTVHHGMVLYLVVPATTGVPVVRIGHVENPNGERGLDECIDQLSHVWGIGNVLAGNREDRRWRTI